MVSIGSAGNTKIPTLLALRAKGYKVTLLYTVNLNDMRNGEQPEWNAEKTGQFFSATSPEELLGLIAMWEIRGDDWLPSSEEPDLLAQLQENALTYDNDDNIVEVEYDRAGNIIDIIMVKKSELVWE